MKFIFAVLYVSWTMGLTLVIKRKFFNIYNNNDGDDDDDDADDKWKKQSS